MSKARELANLGNAYSDGALSNRNLIINGAMQVAQRGTSFSTSGSDRFCLDRWALNPIGASPCSAQQLFDADLQMNTFRVTKQTSSGDTQIIYKIEGFKQFHNQPFTVSYWVKTNSARDVYLASGVGYSGGFLPIGDTTFSATTSWQRVSHTFSATDLSSYTQNNSSWLRLELRLGDGITNVNASDYIEFTGVQLEVGDTTTPFEHRSYGDELARCQRYFERFSYPAGSNRPVVIGTWFSTTGIHSAFRYATKRSPPTVSVSASTDFAAYINTSTAATVTSLSISQQTTDVCNFNPLAVTGGAVGTVNAATLISMVNTVSGAHIDVDAEL